MRICIVGHSTPFPDEGVRSVAVQLARALRAHHEVEQLPIQHPTTWRRIRQFRPDILHFVLSPTGVGLAVVKILSLTCTRARTVVSAPHPGNGAFSRWTRPFKPDLVLTQALDSEREFQKGGHRTLFLPNGVDTDRFVPVSEKTKRRLRKRYGIGNRFVVLHVGPIKRGRNVQMLARLQGGNRQVLLVGRPSDPAEKRVVEEMEKRDCIIWSQYFERIEEIYALSDCYVFPTFERRCCIETPLSVLEALACNLPVASTPFGALPRIAREGEGLIYAQTVDELDSAIARIESGGTIINTRTKVLQLSWTHLAHQLEVSYGQLLQRAWTPWSPLDHLVQTATKAREE